MSFRRPVAPFMEIFADSNGDNRISETGRPRGRPFPLWDSRPRQQAPRHRRRRQRPRGTVRAGFSICGGFLGKGGQILGRSDAWTIRRPGAGRGQILPAAEAQTVGQPHRNFREIRGGDLFFSKRQPRGRQAGRHLLDVLQSSAGNHAAAGRPRARSATTGGRICRPGALEPSKVNAPRHRIPGNAAISPAGTAEEIGKSKHPSASIQTFRTP